MITPNSHTHCPHPTLGFPVYHGTTSTKYFQIMQICCGNRTHTSTGYSFAVPKRSPLSSAQQWTLIADDTDMLYRVVPHAHDGKATRARHKEPRSFRTIPVPPRRSARIRTAGAKHHPEPNAQRRNHPTRWLLEDAALIDQ